jgi:hypothetical protein
MSVRGGFLVVGVDKRGKPIGTVTDAQASLFDEARLRPKLLKVPARQPTDLQPGP